MVKEINCDIFEAPIDVLVHQANCFHTMGAGIALEIRQRFPEAYTADLKTEKGAKEKLGTYSTAKVNYKQIKYIVNLYGQHHFGRDFRMTRYDAVDVGLNLLKDNLVKSKEKLVVGVPYKLGCCNGGGNWTIVRTIIEEAFKDYEPGLLICKNA